ncbi:hypothetical protein AB0M28_24010 [Streptomyces sp. NPDC051940]|uniref:hypothetical protein n=1 Tax=Streptomyces sp. NPDC051940 TaxID=3155675 RepID=UPI00343972B9
MNVDEQDLAQVFDDAVGGVRPDTRALVAGAERRGRLLCRRRWALAGGAVVTPVAAVAALSVFGAALPTIVPGGTDTYTLPGASPGGGLVTVPDFAGRDTPAPQAEKVALTGRATVGLLTDLLPDGKDVSGQEGQNTVDQPDVPVMTFGSVKVESGFAGSEVQVNVQEGFGQDWPDPGSEGAKNSDPSTLEEFYSCAYRGSQDKLTKCGTDNLPDGSVLIAYEERHGLLLERHVDVLRADGTRIALGTSNGRDVEDGPVVSLKPPLGLAQLYEIAVSPRWQPWLTRAELAAAEKLTDWEGPVTPNGTEATPEDAHR